MTLTPRRPRFAFQPRTLGAPGWEGRIQLFFLRVTIQ